MPETLAVSNGDTDLEIPEPESGFYGQSEVEKMRMEKWHRITKTMEADGKGCTLKALYFLPSPATRVRADEIIAAFSNWDRRSKRRPNGFCAAQRATDEAVRRYSDIEDRIFGTRAITFAGMIAKARLHEHDGHGRFADSIAQDLLAIAEAKQPA